jgi:hypothetical protein
VNSGTLLRCFASVFLILPLAMGAVSALGQSPADVGSAPPQDSLRPPFVTGVSPDPIIASNQAQIITVLGGNFTADTRVTFRYLAQGAKTPLVFAGVPLRSFNSGSLSVFFIIGSAEGAWSLEATNANGTTGEFIFLVISSNRGAEGILSANETAQPEAQTPAQEEGTRLPSATELENWRHMMGQTPKPKKGCFEATYPETEWREVQCTTAPNIPLLPARRNGTGAATVGDGADYAAAVMGAVTSATGEFDSVSGVDTETDSLQGANAFTLQLNTNFFHSAVCKGASTPANCLAWEQFVFWNDANYAYAAIQYWLIDYGPKCPSPSWNQYPTESPTDCWLNSTESSSVPAQGIAALSSLELNGAAGAGSTDDSVTLHAGTKVYSAAGDNHFSDLGSLWTSAEFNIFGYGNGSTAEFNLGSATVATIAVRTEVDNGAVAPPQCDEAGYTAETNNLTLVGTPATETSVALPSIVFTESNGSKPTAASCTPEPEHAQTTTTVKSSLNPSIAGQSVNFTATVSGGNSPTGTVGFNSNGSSISGCSAVPLSSGAAQCTTPALPVGADTIVATYSGDANNTSSTSAPLTQTVNAPQKTTPAVAVSANPAPITTLQGTTVTVTVTGTAGKPTPTGTVTLTSPNFTTQTGNLNSSGVATIPVAAGALPVGTDPLTATYNGDSNYNTATRTKFITVTAAAPKTTPTVAVSANPAPITTAQGTTVTVTVTGTAGKPTPTGTVTLTSPNFATQTGNLNSSGVATIPVAAGALPVGTDPLTATYNGDGNYNTAAKTKFITVTAAAASFTVSVNTNSQTVTQGQSASFTFTVKSVSGFKATVTPAALNLPTGYVAANTAWNPLTITPAANGSASSTLTVATNASTTPGTYSVKLQGSASGYTTQTLPVTIVVNSNAQAPTATTTAATNIGSSGGTMNGSGNPNGLSTTIWFQWGLTNALGQNSGTATTTGNTTASWSTTLSGAAQNTTYFYRIVAQSSAGTTYGSILSFTTTSNAQAPTATTTAATNIGSSGGTMNGSVNPNGLSTTIWFQWGLTNALGQNSGTATTTGNTAASWSTTLSGAAQNTTYFYRIVAQSSAGTTYGSILSFTTTSNAQAPTATTTAATNIGSSGGTMNGSVNPNGLSTTIWFQWGLTNALGQNSGTATTTGNTAASWSTTLSGAAQNTTYFYRIVAQSSAGTTYGSILSFTTTSNAQAPTATTTAATKISSSGGTMNGSVNPNGLSTTIWFQWGLTNALGQNSGTATTTGNTAASWSTTLSGAAQNTTYFYRIVAQSSAGTTYGSILSFTTAP